MIFGQLLILIHKKYFYLCVVYLKIPPSSGIFREFLVQLLYKV